MTFEGPPPYLARPPRVTKPKLEPIQEVTVIEESVSQEDDRTNKEFKGQEEIEPNTPLEQELNIPTLDDKMAEELWQDVWKYKEKDGVSETSAPISIVGLT